MLYNIFDICFLMTIILFFGIVILVFIVLGKRTLTTIKSVISSKKLKIDCINDENFNIISKYFESGDSNISKDYGNFIKIESLNIICFKVSDEFDFEILKYDLEIELLLIKERTNNDIDWNITMQ